MPLYNHEGYILPKDRDYGVEKEVDRVMSSAPSFAIAGKPIAGAGKGKIVLGWKIIEQARGKFENRIQGIGDCVSFGYGGGFEYTLSCDIVIRGENETFVDYATEWGYGASRVLVGKGRLGNSDGSVGAWIAKAGLIHGNLFRLPYDNVDLSTYSKQRAKSWGYRGLPLSLEETADIYPISEMCIPARGYEDCRDAIACGYGVFCCSNLGFSDKRDKEGFSKPSGSWAHCMHMHSIDDTRRPGVIIQNSWPASWISGPESNNPPGSFWCDASVVDRICRQNDTWIIPGVNGIKRSVIDWEWV
jgi:hypothetical protein